MRICAAASGRCADLQVRAGLGMVRRSGASCLFIGFLAFTVAMLLIEPRSDSFLIAALDVVVFGSFAAFGLRSYARIRDRVAVSSEGIWSMPGKGGATFTAWSEIANVKANDAQQKLVLADKTGRRRIGLEYQLENFGKLREYVVSHTMRPTSLNANAVDVFHRTWSNKGILLGGSVLDSFLCMAKLSAVRAGTVSSSHRICGLPTRRRPAGPHECGNYEGSNRSQISGMEAHHSLWFHQRNCAHG